MANGEIPRRQQRQRLRTAVLLIVLLLAIGACSDSDAAIATEEATPLSAEEFAEQGNQICVELTAQLEEISEAGGEIVEFNEARTAGFAELFALQPPADIEDDFERLKEIRQEFVDAGAERIPEPDIALRLGPEWDATAARLNLNDCAA